jgi:RES domain-containing protein
MTLVAYRVACERVLDLTDPAVRGQVDCTRAVLACAWEDLAGRRLVPPTWDLAERLVADGATGVLVPSLAPGCDAAQINLVLWQWSAGSGCRVQVVDDQQRLPRDGRSWE